MFRFERGKRSRRPSHPFRRPKTYGLTLALLTLAASSLIPNPVSAQKQTTQLTAEQKKLDAEFKKTIVPILQANCVACHSGDSAKGKLDLEKYTSIEQILAEQNQWEKVIQNVRAEVMPPPGMPQPTKEQRATLVSWIQRAYSSNCNVIQAGKVTIRRMNRTEYNYTVQDLFGLELSPADDFPSDDVGYGLDNIGDVLSLSPLHMEKYLDAARILSETAIVVTKPEKYKVELSQITGANGISPGPDSQAVFSTRALAKAPVNLKRGGNFELRILASQTPGGNEDAQLSVGIDGLHQVVSVKSIGEQTTEYKFQFELKPGPHQVFLQFNNDFYDPNGPEGRKDRNLVIWEVDITGPEGASAPENLPASHRNIITRNPDGINDAKLAREVLTNFGERAYRRPLESSELDRLMAVYSAVRKSGDPFERAMQVCIQAILVNPNFLFRVELDQKAQTTQDVAVNDYELASRLSYFLWSSLPDYDLLQLAKAGKLREPKTLDAQIERMLKSPKAERFAKNFSIQWLELKRIVESSPDPTLFGGFTDRLRDDLLSESELFFADMMNNNRPIMDFITSKETFLNGRLAQHYGVAGVVGDNFRKVDVSKQNRGGILGMGSVLVVTSNPNRTSPVRRGKWVMEAVLGTPPPPPPPDVGVLADDKTAITTKNIRQRMEQHRTNPACAGCHKPLDAIGFSLENFDAVGRWRTQDGLFPVDAKGEMPDGSIVEGVDDLRKLVVSRKSDFMRALTEKMTMYALGRGIDASDGCLIDSIIENTKKRGERVQDLIHEIIKSDAFLKRTVIAGNPKK